MYCPTRAGQGAASAKTEPRQGYLLPAQPHLPSLRPASAKAKLGQEYLRPAKPHVPTPNNSLQLLPLLLLNCCCCGWCSCCCGELTHFVATRAVNSSNEAAAVCAYWLNTSPELADYLASAQPHSATHAQVTSVLMLLHGVKCSAGCTHWAPTEDTERCRHRCPVPDLGLSYDVTLSERPTAVP